MNQPSLQAQASQNLSDEEAPRICQDKIRDQIQKCFDSLKEAKYCESCTTASKYGRQCAGMQIGFYFLWYLVFYGCEAFEDSHPQVKTVWTSPKWIVTLLSLAYLGWVASKACRHSLHIEWSKYSGPAPKSYMRFQTRSSSRRPIFALFCSHWTSKIGYVIFVFDFWLRLSMIINYGWRQTRCEGCEDRLLLLKGAVAAIGLNMLVHFVEFTIRALIAIHHRRQEPHMFHPWETAPHPESYQKKPTTDTQLGSQDQSGTESSLVQGIVEQLHQNATLQARATDLKAQNARITTVITHNETLVVGLRKRLQYFECYNRQLQKDSDSDNVRRCRDIGTLEQPADEPLVRHMNCKPEKCALKRQLGRLTIVDLAKLHSIPEDTLGGETSEPADLLAPTHPT